MKARDIEEWISTLPKERQEKIATRSDEMIAQHMALVEFRKALGVSQKELARLIDMDQANLIAYRAW